MTTGQRNALDDPALTLRGVSACCAFIRRHVMLGHMKTALLASVALLCPLASWAADDIRPFDAKVGLWESTTTMEMSGLPAMPAMPKLTPEQMSRMPPEARKQLESAMGAGMGAPRT